jgi:hypothetical protein
MDKAQKPSNSEIMEVLCELFLCHVSDVYSISNRERKKERKKERCVLYFANPFLD